MNTTMIVDRGDATGTVALTPEEAADILLDLDHDNGTEATKRLYDFLEKLAEPYYARLHARDEDARTPEAAEGRHA
jgi:hypothetical protein